VGTAPLRTEVIKFDQTNKIVINRQAKHKNKCELKRKFWNNIMGDESNYKVLASAECLNLPISLTSLLFSGGDPTKPILRVMLFTMNGIQGRKGGRVYFPHLF